MKINPCPFCDHVDVEWCEPELGTYAIDCPECQCIGPFSDSPESASEKWNKAGQRERTRASVLTQMCLSHERRIELLRDAHELANSEALRLNKLLQKHEPGSPMVLNAGHNAK